MRSVWTVERVHTFYDNAMRVLKYNTNTLIGGFILLHFNCDSEVTAVRTGYTSTSITTTEQEH